ncbi:hypothetical protein [Nocardia cyriacigeorgica]|nr:hypothetical protein [Nocardia cyriacigeorgica]
MGFLRPNLPVVDYDEWSKGTRSEKIQRVRDNMTAFIGRLYN